MAELNVEDKLVRTTVKLRLKISSFYSAIYSSLSHNESDMVEKMEFCGKNMYYNPKYIETLEPDEVTFEAMHLAVHIGLLHVVRLARKKQTRKSVNYKLFNIACDLIANSLLYEEFGVGPERPVTYIKMPKGEFFCSTVSVDTDTVEDLYEYMLSQMDNDKDFITVRGKKQIADYDNMQNYAELKIDKKDIENYTPDINTTEMSDGVADADTVERQSRQMLNAAYMKSKMMGGGAQAGVGGVGLAREVGKIMSSHMDWRKYLKRFCIKMKESEASFATPDKRMYYQSLIYPGHSKELSNEIDNVKICFDTSGSISEDDLGRFLGQVLKLTTQYKVDADLICWDGEVESVTNLNKKSTLKNNKMYGGGGTDPSCIFRYFDSPACKRKPYVTIIFTDGYIIEEGLNNPSWGHKYKDTLWVLTKEYNRDFRPPFGKVTEVEQ